MQVLNRMLAPLAGAVLAMGAAPAQAAPPSGSAAVEEPLDTDRQFSADAADDNLVDGIAAMLAPDAISPTAAGTFARGKGEVVDALNANPANATSTADWAPVRGGISADGLHGFTYGFMNIQGGGLPDRRAKYVSYWIKRPEGWRVFGYKRFGSAPGSVVTTVRAPALPPVMLPDRPSNALRNKYEAELGAREQAFSDRAQEAGLRQAFLEFGSADAMNSTAHPSDFVYGNVAISQGLPPDTPSPVVWAADEEVTVASTGDLGVTFGLIRVTGTTTVIPFFTIWRRDRTSDDWLYVAE
jgi:ketosteroid isomerase-like protein